MGVSGSQSDPYRPVAVRMPVNLLAVHALTLHLLVRSPGDESFEATWIHAPV